MTNTTTSGPAVYAVEVEHEDGPRWNAGHGMTLAEAVDRANGLRENGDGSERCWVVDESTGRTVTRGEVRRALGARAVWGC